ncbi:hypothetical protein [Actinomadura parmotrematis]|uniref:J domain-containing protein n=1 Tax=Actinomadura parmotrematis TaxID=2864039 RepID=A0ABS7FVU4_9ACTN|nr:hypothetical protein [Actinomadura parmotrematis]MBW8483804.1 hypothetical protein [Actinomadura parmotrematis]
MARRTAEEKAAFRAWARAHHPDAGGDPAEFAAGMRRWNEDGGRGAPGGARPAADVVGVRRHRGPGARLKRWRERRRRAKRLQ